MNYEFHKYQVMMVDIILSQPVYNPNSGNVGTFLKFEENEM